MILGPESNNGESGTQIQKEGQSTGQLTWTLPEISRHEEEKEVEGGIQNGGE